MEQVIATMVTVAYKYIARQVALAGLLCLAYRYVRHTRGEWGHRLAVDVPI